MRVARASMMGLMDTQSPWLDDDQQDLWQALLTVVIALPAALDRQLQRDAGISNFEYGVLAQLSMADGATMRLSDLARVCDSTQPRLSKVMDRFEARDWVARRPDPGDGRYTLAALTDAGRQKLVESAPSHVAQVKRLVFDPLSAAQRRHLETALTRIADTVRRDFEGG
ncbi:MarR family protein [Streptomyces sp. ADI97-07]|nr:MarR family protein [Streptomyces sp. ADI97-07]